MLILRFGMYQKPSLTSLTDKQTLSYSTHLYVKLVVNVTVKKLNIPGKIHSGDLAAYQGAPDIRGVVGLRSRDQLLRRWDCNGLVYVSLSPTRWQQRATLGTILQSLGEVIGLNVEQWVEYKTLRDSFRRI